MDIEDYNEERYRDYQIYLGSQDVTELIKCSGCFGEFEENEIEPYTIITAEKKDEMLLCKECINYYKEENQ